MICFQEAYATGSMPGGMDGTEHVSARVYHHALVQHEVNAKFFCCLSKAAA